MFNKIFSVTFLKLFIFGFALTQFFIFAGSAKAAAVCSSATVHIVARNQAGAVIPGISYEISEKTTNSDGEIRPGRVVSSGKIDTILGEGKSVFTPSGVNYYVVKMYDKSATYGAFYFYDGLTAACGEEKTFTGYLSALEIELRDASGVLRKNISFTISQQAYDANGQPVKQKSATVATLNSDVYGRNLIYLADSGHTIDRKPISYVFSTAGFGGSEFALYNIAMADKTTTEINYVFSEIMIKFRDKKTNNLPVGTKVEFLKQEIDASGRKVVGKLIKELSIDSYGYVQLEYPSGVYYARIKRTNGEYFNFPDITVNDQRRTTVIYDVEEDANEEVACTTNTVLTVVARKSSGDYIPGVKVELYEKIIDANGKPAAGSLVVKGTTNSVGNGAVTLKPNLGKTYIIKMYDKNSSAGAFWYYDDIKFVCGEDKRLVKNLSSVSLTVRDPNSALLKDYAFSLYLQKKDVDGNLLKTKDYLVADAKTNAAGQATVFVTGGDPAQYQDAAAYLISIRSGNGMIFDRSDIYIIPESDTKIEYILSGLKLTAVDAAGHSLAKGASVEIFEQKTDGKNKILGKSVSRISLDEYGKAVTALPAGTYALSVKDKTGKQMIVWDVKISNGAVNTKTAKFTGAAVLTPAANPPSTASSSPDKMTAAAASALANRVKGKVLLQTQANGEAWYVSPSDKKRYYLRDGEASFRIMKSLGTGITDSDLSKIPIGILSAQGEADCDLDGLPDALEKAIGTGECDVDTDGDKYTDSDEVLHKYNPFGPGKMKLDEKLAARLSGEILLQVESNGQAWYLNPKDKKRYYLKDGLAAFKVMRYLSLGITNSDLAAIAIAD